MTPEKEQALTEKYPKIFCGKLIDGCITCGDGWYDILDALASNIQHHIDQNEIGNKYRKPELQKEIPQVEAAQVKEKFGGLRFYINGGDEEIHGMVRMAESMSYRICEDCGCPGKTGGKGWIRTLCETCRSSQEKRWSR